MKHVRTLSAPRPMEADLGTQRRFLQCLMEKPSSVTICKAEKI